MDDIEKFKDENKALKLKISLYEISTKLDHKKIEDLKDELNKYKKAKDILYSS